MTPRHLPLAAAACVLAASLAASCAETLYQTDFEAFTAGDDKRDDLNNPDLHWVGTQAWEGDAANLYRSVHGIDQDIIVGGGLGRTAFIGFAQPATTLAWVRRPFLYAPGPGDLPVIEVETLVGIQDSVEKVARDSFFVSIHNSAGDFIAGVRFANANPSFGIWREDGVAAHDTGFAFFRGELHLLALRIDLPANTWSAWLLGEATLPLFENAPFSAAGLPVDFGHLAYEWLVTAALPGGYGDNWMLVADAVVRRAPRGSEPFRITSCTRLAGTTTVTWPGEAGFDYQVWHSADGAQWLDTLPGSAFPGITTAGPMTFADPEPAARRFYRVVRSSSP